jgi:type I restriction enzyme M protein
MNLALRGMAATAMRKRASSECKVLPQVVTEARGNMVTLPGTIFFSTHIPVCLCFLAKNKNADAKRSFLEPRKQAIFGDANLARSIANNYDA